MSQEFWPRVVRMSKDLNKNRLSSLLCFFFPMWFPSQFMTILWVLLEPACSFYELFASLGSPTTGRGIDFAPFWSETRGVLPVMAYTLKLRPKGVHFSGFRKGMFASSNCKLRRPGIKVWHDSDRASISPSDPIRPVAGPDLQIGGGGSSRFWDKGGARSQKIIFLGPFWSKTKGAPGSPAPLP